MVENRLEKDVFILDIPTSTDIAISSLQTHLVIALILLILTYLLIGKKDKTTFQFAGISLLLYVI
jgi:hypothetical protein